jgi:hydroxyacylglutathione hydrolase
MNLEDHTGDIICKARAMSGVATATAAQAAALSEIDLLKLEASGQIGAPANFAALAGLIGLHPVKLEGIARGWAPAEKDLSVWRELRCITTTAQGMAVNCFLIWDEVTRDAALFDTGWDAETVFQQIDEHQLQLRHLFVTHGHHDHIAALSAIRERYPKVRLHTGAKDAPVEQRNRQSDFIHLGSLRITHRDTPGHSADGTSYIIGTWPDDAPHVVVVGDAVFAGSMGRGNQSWELARQKVREQILGLPPETLICPGHGPLTTVAEEREHNPFF